MLHTIRGGKSPQTPQPKGAHIVNTPATADDLTIALSDTERMASILSTLLEERITDTGKGPTLSVRRQDADDIRFAGEQLLAMLTRAGDIWRAIP
jgi:hypothetical protein